MECKKDFKAIVEFHLVYHGMTFKKYKKKYPDAPITDPYNCEVCGLLVDNSQSKRGKYCKECAKDVKQDQITTNARNSNRKRKLALQKEYTQANREYGVTINENSSNSDRIRIDPYHAEWNYIPSYKWSEKKQKYIPMQDTKGTFSEKSLDVNKKTGRIKQAEWLRREINKEKRAKERKNNGI
jgi:hypothetical protein